MDEINVGAWIFQQNYSGLAIVKIASHEQPTNKGLVT